MQQFYSCAWSRPAENIYSKGKIYKFGCFFEKLCLFSAQPSKVIHAEERDSVFYKLKCNFHKGCCKKKLGHGSVTCPNFDWELLWRIGLRVQDHGVRFMDLHTTVPMATTIKGPGTFHLIGLDSIQMHFSHIQENLPQTQKKNKRNLRRRERNWLMIQHKINKILSHFLLLFDNQRLCQK